MSSESKNVAIVYHFFANYRGPIMESLVSNTEHNYRFISGAENWLMPGVPIWKPPAEYQTTNAKCYSLPFGFVFQPQVLKLIFDGEVDVIVFLGDWRFISTWITASVCRLMGKTVLFWTHGWLTREKGVRAVVRKLFYRLANGLLLYGNTAKQIGVENGFNKERLYVIYNSLDYQQQKKIRESVQHQQLVELKASLFQKPELPLLLFIGRLNQEKRVDLLIKAVGELKKNNLPVNALIVGGGVEEKKLKTLATAQNGAEVNFYGPCYDELKTAKLMMCADLNVCPAAAGLTVIHSMAFGVPVVTSNNMAKHGPEVEAIVPWKTGAFYDSDDLDSLVKVITKFINSSSDTMAHCIDTVEKKYNASFQTSIIQNAINLRPPNPNLEQHIE